MLECLTVLIDPTVHCSGDSDMQYGRIHFLKYVDPIVKQTTWRSDDEKVVAESVLAFFPN
jgi:hypothetical protein